MRFGIGCEREHTLEEIGQEFDVTRERIRQIEAKALRQLRAPERARRLRALMAARCSGSQRPASTGVVPGCSSDCRSTRPFNPSSSVTLFRSSVSPSV